MVKIVIADDDEDILIALRSYFRSIGFDVKTVNNGTAVADSVAAFKPDIVLMDVNLGLTDGRYICRQLKLQQHPSLPVLLMSAETDYYSNWHAFGADDFIGKPFLLKDLSQKIGSLLLT